MFIESVYSESLAADIYTNNEPTEIMWNGRTIHHEQDEAKSFPFAQTIHRSHPAIMKQQNERKSFGEGSYEVSAETKSDGETTVSGSVSYESDTGATVEGNVSVDSNGNASGRVSVGGKF